ncbi:hypothetical protein Afil01_39500 [Actinorhabdospora filicis]|uniref:non-specific serine/threonine protein kinase n=1 Tax=Actinorhabdospora filicis TaxID=1785913 RepID=A0A9W6SMW8_9ACTN|nr:serine/threonine-protein kinase [Actinorhabdospora filicis]GLZ79143.1 hypothetical protein Afil01_39500 [Actinorhabdospora filicis]
MSAAPEPRPYVVGPDDAPDKYRLRRQVGGGGEAELWEAELTVDGAAERVAVKVLRDRHAVDAGAWRDRWSEQAELLRLMRHPGVVGVHAYFEGARMHLAGETPDPAEGRTHYLVMNWVDGQDLRQWVTEGHDRGAALRHLMQIADVLDWLHEGRATPSGRPVVHGDVSPGNVVINADGQAVLVDFGLFRMATAIALPSAGTQGYLAPEVVLGGEYSPASDRYAFGALAYFVLTGSAPPADPELLRLEIADAVDPGGVADADLLGRIFDPEPAERPAVGDWIRLLRQHSSTMIPRGASLPAPAPRSSLPPPRPPRVLAARRPTVWREPVTTGPVLTVPPPPRSLPRARPIAAPPPKRRFDTWQWLVAVLAVVLVVAFCGLMGAALWANSHGDDSGPMNANSNYSPFILQPPPGATRVPITINGQGYEAIQAAPCAKFTAQDYALPGGYNSVDLQLVLADDNPKGTGALFTVELDGKEAASTTVGQGDWGSLSVRLRDAKVMRVTVESTAPGTCAVLSGSVS